MSFDLPQLDRDPQDLITVVWAYKLINGMGVWMHPRIFSLRWMDPQRGIVGRPSANMLRTLE